MTMPRNNKSDDLINAEFVEVKLLPALNGTSTGAAAMRNLALLCNRLNVPPALVEPNSAGCTAIHAVNGLILTWYDADELDITVHSARDAIVERSLDPDQRRLETFCALECDGRALGCGNYLAFRLRRMPTAGEGVVLQAVLGRWQSGREACSWMYMSRSSRAAHALFPPSRRTGVLAKTCEKRMP